MTDKPLISIIVPVYKVEKFLDRCVNSLINQTYSNLEIILVDDGSPDNCPAMCDAWAEKDNRIKVIHKPNGGQADARNRAIEIAQGEYISFVDSDDYISLDYVEYLLGIMRENDGEIACGSYRIVFGDGEQFDNQPEDELLCLDNVGACKALMGSHYMQMVAPWSKLFPAEIVKAHPFPRGHKHEDEANTYKFYFLAKKTIIGKREIYAYYQNSGSVTHNRTRKNREDVLQAFEEQVEYFEAAGCEELTVAAAERLVGSLVAIAAQGDETFREFIREKRAVKYLGKGVRAKYKLLYYCYLLFGIDINAVLLKLKNK